MITKRKKGPVKLREKKLANGGSSLYFDIYQQGARRYEFLRLYLVRERTASDRRMNRETRRLAETLRRQRTRELQYAAHGVADDGPARGVTLGQWMKCFAERNLKMGKSQSYYDIVMKARRHLGIFRKEDVALRMVDKRFCLDFISYLNGTSLSKTTSAGYLRCLNCALNAAVRADLIKHNPVSLIGSEDRIRIPESHREYLTGDEIVRLVHTPCRRDQVKRAYLFACMCALRLSDIKALKWGDIHRDGNQWRASIVMVKTRRKLWLPLSDEAVRWLPERGAASDCDHIFQLPCLSVINNELRLWAGSAGIRKYLSFHTSRHTNATLLLTLGVDIYTLSKLLGHSELRTTQIYARIVDKRKDDAVNLIPSFSQMSPPPGI